MLKLDRQAFGGLGNHVKFNVPGTKQVDLHTGDAVINEAFGVFVHRRRVFTQDEMQVAVSAGVAALREAKPDWQISAYPELNAWLRYEVAAAPAVDTATPAAEPEAATAEEAPAQSHKKSKKKAEPC